MPKPSRRALLFGGAAIVAAPPLALLGLRGVDGPNTIVARYLRRMLPGLAVPEGELLGFVREHLARRGPGGADRVKLETILAIIEQPWLEKALPVARPAYDYFTRTLLTSFLFSTDFFTAAGQKPERTRFIAYADPYAVGCRNPLARTDLDVT